MESKNTVVYSSHYYILFANDSSGVFFEDVSTESKAYRERPLV